VVNKGKQYFTPASLPPEVQNLRLPEQKSPEGDSETKDGDHRVRFSGLENSSRRLQSAVTKYWLLLIPLLLVMCWLGARNLNADAIWSDERFSILDTGGAPYELRTPAQIWEGVAQRNPWHAPGYFIILSGWGRLVGWSPPMLRAMSLLFGMLAVAWTYRLGHDLVSRRVGLYAAAIVATSAFFIHYLHELRMYTIFVLLTAFVLWVYWRIVRYDVRVGAHGRAPLQTRNRFWLYLGLFIGAASMLYLHYFASLPLMAIGLYHLLFVPKNKRWWYVVAALGFAGVLFLPWLQVLIAGLGLAAEDEGLRMAALPPGQTLERLSYLFSNGLALLLLIVVALALLARGRGVKQVWFFTVMILLALLAVNAIVQVMHIGRMRYLIVLWPPLALLTALGILQLERLRKGISILGLGAWMGLGMWMSLTPNFMEGVDGSGYIFPWHIALREMRPYLQPDDVITVQLPEGMLNRITQRNHDMALYYTEDLFVRFRIVETNPQVEEQQIEEYQTTMEFIGDAQRVWVTYEGDKQPSALPRFESMMSEQYQICPAIPNQSILHLDLYARSAVCCVPTPDKDPVIRYGGDIALTGVEPLPETLSDTLPVRLGWSIAPDVPAYQYSVALHVLDSQDNLVAQADYGLPPVFFTCEPAQVDISALPAGDYGLYAIVYAWETGERLTGEVVETGETGERLLVGHFRVMSDE
jgi:hypothetical protein